MGKPKPKRRVADELTSAIELKIIGGKHRGRKLTYEPFRRGEDPVTRPMKHRVRESIFNLVGVGSEGRHAIDLFAGTGALGLEALSRGSVHATFIERHVPTAHIIEQNIKGLGVEGQSTLLMTSAFLWGKRNLTAGDGQWWRADGQSAADAPTTSFGTPPAPGAAPWLVFCSPPYDFFVSRKEETIGLISAIMEHCPPDSIVVTESDERFDATLLPTGEQYHGVKEWDVRRYSPAVVGIWQKQG
ncbi:RsmD family RNA methyltransferase [Lacipirellula limnantheis]|uniref:Ribosomal RNA small subunit methyltransferase D n=1 Tax=Lacipirellula limnantheis TaxID=2528024 RepID=A0A517TRS3_9BACT|nr:RsmD family RNA methyltransferase [Lacipirellula limnantheis]QDT71058.1 Ribosomal RNA small subunit methyltransferase D [Lacipirellula limnantheis]